MTATGVTGASEWHARGTVAYQLGDFKRAYECFVHAYDLKPFPAFVYNQAASLDLLGNTDAAVRPTSATSRWTEGARTPRRCAGASSACARAGWRSRNCRNRHNPAAMASSTAHRRRRFSGRDPDEEHRTATPLELLFDLTIVVAFGTAADELAHFIADGHAWAGIGGFAFAAFAVSWAWVNYSWFASAYDTDDWLFRLATMVQMVGVIVLALGLPQMFASIDHGDTLDNGVMVAGYVIMRVRARGPVVAGVPPGPARARRPRARTWPRSASPSSAGSCSPSSTCRSRRRSP